MAVEDEGVAAFLRPGTLGLRPDGYLPAEVGRTAASGYRFGYDVGSKAGVPIFLLPKEVKR